MIDDQTLFNPTPKGKILSRDHDEVPESLLSLKLPSSGVLTPLHPSERL